MKAMLLGIVVVVLWSSPEARVVTANALREAAEFLEPKESSTENPKHFRIPNPFYLEESK